MISYRDRTFCPFWENCKDGTTCQRAQTKEVNEGALKAGLPVSVFVSVPACFEPLIDYAKECNTVLAIAKEAKVTGRLVVINTRKPLENTQCQQ